MESPLVRFPCTLRKVNRNNQHTKQIIKIYGSRANIWSAPPASAFHVLLFVARLPNACERVCGGGGHDKCKLI